MRRTHTKSFLLFLLLSFIGPMSWAESVTHTENSGQTTASSIENSQGQRPTQAAPLTDRELKFISDNFFLSQLTVWNRYSEKIPQAIEKAMKEQSEKESSQVIAELMGMVNKKQAELLLDNAKKEKETESAKKPNGGDERYIALMERFVWGAKLFLKSPSKEESAEKYNQEFQEAFKGVEAKNQEILEKVKQAADGNDQAKEWLRSNLDQSSLLSFVEGQKKFGNGQLADRILDAVSFKEGKNKFLDMSLQNETQRLHLGQTQKSVSSTFDKFIESRRGFNGAVASFSPHSSTPMKQWFVDDKGALKTGAPSSFQNTTPPSGSRVSNPNINSPNNRISSTPSAQAPGVSSVTSNGSSAASAKILQTCNKCHAGEVSIDSNGVLSKEGSPRTKAEILEAFNKVRQMAQPTAKLTAEERSAVMALISQWVK